ncbi:MAG: AhpC/TSA family protein [Bacteroidales bacterium]|nr:AhpC/TSA family protein [Bacteroidales bacterium]MBN2749656.1 AhpC/TSA family protein [Bacteroidales bacterium]
MFRSIFFERLVKSSLLLNLFLTMGLLVYACAPRSNEVEVNGAIAGFSNSYIYLMAASDDALLAVDSAETSGLGEFSFTLVVNEPAFYVLQPKGSRNQILLLLTPTEKVTVTASDASLRHYSINGSQGSARIKELNGRLNDVVAQIDSLAARWRATYKEANFDSIRTAIDSTYATITREHKAYTVRFIQDNSYSLATIVALYQQYDNKNYVLDSKADFKHFQLVDSLLYPIYPHNPLVKNLHKNVMLMASQIELRERRGQMLAVGSKFPVAEFPALNGEAIDITALGARYILVNFWATWCDGCVATNKSLVDVYADFAPKGFAVVNFSLDANMQELADYIKSDTLSWSHSSDFMQWQSPIVDTLRVSTVPSNYLVDRWGTIRGVNLYGKKLRDELARLMP